MHPKVFVISITPNGHPTFLAFIIGGGGDGLSHHTGLSGIRVWRHRENRKHNITICNKRMCIAIFYLLSFFFFLHTSLFSLLSLLSHLSLLSSLSSLLFYLNFFPSIASTISIQEKVVLRFSITISPIDFWRCPYIIEWPWILILFFVLRKKCLETLICVSNKWGG